jgi:hypothetical protein
MRKLLFNYSFYSHPEIGKFQGVTLCKRIRAEHNISSQYIHKNKASRSRSFTYWVETRILMLCRNKPPSGARRFLLPAPLPALSASAAVFTGLGADRPSDGGVWVAAPTTAASHDGRVGEVLRLDDGEGEDWRTGVCELGED